MPNQAIHRTLVIRAGDGRHQLMELCMKKGGTRHEEVRKLVIHVREVLATLATQRPIFHSEADFQHAFAWEIHQRLPAASIRLEFPFQQQGKYYHLDVWVINNDSALAVELKYKKRALSVSIRDEQFYLTDQRAHPLGRYDFIKDIQRLEQITASRANTVGYAVLLTNDSAYWSMPKRDRQPIDADFRLKEGRIIKNELKWGPSTSKGTMRGREKPLKLLGKYAINWEDYSQLKNASYGAFRYIVVEVR